MSRRGAHPQDPEFFGEQALPVLRTATDELSWLLGRGYGLRSALLLVGERHALVDRQREAVGRAACAPGVAAARRDRCWRGDLGGADVWLDGFNVIIISERVLGHGPVIRGRDSAYRDVAGVHGSWHRSTETVPAIAAIGAALGRRNVGSARWLLDRPVANGGRLAALLAEHALGAGLSWRVEQVDGVDRALAHCGGLVATSDGWIHDRGDAWLNIVGDVVAETVDPWIVDLG